MAVQWLGRPALNVEGLGSIPAQETDPASRTAPLPPRQKKRVETLSGACSVNLITSLTLWLQTLPWLPSTLNTSLPSTSSHLAPLALSIPLVSSHSLCSDHPGLPAVPPTHLAHPHLGAFAHAVPLPRALFVTYYPHLIPQQRCRERGSCVQGHTSSWCESGLTPRPDLLPPNPSPLPQMVSRSKQASRPVHHGDE